MSFEPATEGWEKGRGIYLHSSHISQRGVVATERQKTFTAETLRAVIF
jgi:hypothetical protein